jgi:hypothetical protein
MGRSMRTKAHWKKSRRVRIPREGPIRKSQSVCNFNSVLDLYHITVIVNLSLSQLSKYKPSSNRYVLIICASNSKNPNPKIFY